MNVMLIALAASIGVGLFGEKYVHREMRIVTAIACAMVVLYLAHPNFMS